MITKRDPNIAYYGWNIDESREVLDLGTIVFDNNRLTGLDCIIFAQELPILNQRTPIIIRSKDVLYEGEAEIYAEPGGYLKPVAYIWIDKSSKQEIGINLSDNDYRIINQRIGSLLSDLQRTNPRIREDIDSHREVFMDMFSYLYGEDIIGRDKALAYELYLYIQVTYRDLPQVKQIFQE